MRDGRSIETRFRERTGQFVVTDAGRFRGRDLRAMIVVKGDDV